MRVLLPLLLLGAITAGGARAETTVYTADFEDGEVNPGKLGGIENTVPYPSAQPTPFGQTDSYGWQNRARFTLDGDTTIVDAVAHTGSNSARVGNRFLRCDIELTVQAGLYAFRFWYMVPDGNGLTFDNKIVIKDETNGHMFFTVDDIVTAPAADTWYSRTFFINTVGYAHVGETIDLRFGATFADGANPDWYAYTDDWSIVFEPISSAFLDVTDLVGLDAYMPDPNALADSSAAWGDFNRDGWIDLYIGTNSDTNFGLFENNAGGGFIERDYIVWQNIPAMFVDYDNSGWPDVVSAKAGGHVSRSESAQAWTWLPDLDDPHPYQSEGEAWADFDNDGDLDCYRAGWTTGPEGPHFPDAIFTNQGNTRLERTWWQENESERNAGRSVTCADFDEDDDIDIYVSNYFLCANNLWVNDGTGNFTDAAAALGVDADDIPCTDPNSGTVYPGAQTIASAWGDLDNDGHLDLVVGNLSHGEACSETPRFYRNLGPPSYAFGDVSDTVAMPYVQSHASPTLADFDNDGDLDVFITAVSGTGYAGESSTLLRNDGNWNFTDVSAMYGLGLVTPETNFQAAWGDYDNDGDLDLFTGRRLYMNSLSNGNHWLMVRLEGDGVSVNRDAIGAQVRIDLGGGNMLLRQVENSTGWGNQNDPRLHFGLGSNNGPVDLQIAWPNGVTETISGVAVDQVFDHQLIRPKRKKDDMVVYRPLADDPTTWFATRPLTDPDYWDDPDGSGGPDEMPIDSQLVDFGLATDTPRLGDVTGDGLDDLVVLQQQGAAFAWIAAHTVDTGGGIGELSQATTSSMWPAGDPGRFIDAFLADMNSDGAEDAILTEAYSVDPQFIAWFRYYSVPGSGLDITDSSSLIWGNRTIDDEPADRPIVGDFNGDGYADVGVYRNHSVYGANIQVLKSRTDGTGFGNPFDSNDVAVTPAGTAGTEYRVFVGDFDLDAFGSPADDVCLAWKTEIDGSEYWAWQIFWNDGDTGYFIPSFAWVWMIGTDTPFVADVNGDGRDDLCVSRCEASTGRIEYYTVFTDQWGYPAGQDLGGLILYTDDDGEFGYCGLDTPLFGDLDTANDSDEIVLFSGPGAGWRAQYSLAPDYWVDDVIDTQLDDFGFSSTTPIGAMYDLPLVGDVTGDGVDDVVFRADNGWFPPQTAWYAGHTQVDPNTGAGTLSADVQSTIVAHGGPIADVLDQFLADVNGDGADDAVSVDIGLNWQAAHSIPGVGLAQLSTSPLSGVSQFGLPGDVPIVGDFDGDGYVDICAYRPSTGFWYVRKSTVLGITDDTSHDVGGQFGGPEWLPLVGDFNGDGRDDAVVYGDPEPDNFWNVGIVLADSAGVIDNSNGIHWLNFGIVDLGDELFIADVNNDGRDDLCARRPIASDAFLWYCVFTPPSANPPNATIDDSAYFGDADMDIPLIGQFNRHVVAIFGDINGDGVVDGGDLIGLADCMSGPDVSHAIECGTADLDDDGDVDMSDVGLLQTSVAGS